ncbi:MAG: hypothetical protein KIT43_07555 [Bauldia sp.]|nr:hypothetical protein [Bauldia sp.]MCW5718406.1 hypothetical protein [Bauldia sp.]
MNSKVFLAATMVVAAAFSAGAEQPSPAENYGQCQGQNRHILSTYQDWLDGAYAAVFAQMAPEDVGPALGDLLPEVRPNARADINALFTNQDGGLTDEQGNPLGCFGIKPGK